MAETTHTPGPWTVIGPVGFVYADDPYGHGQMHVAQVRGWGHLTGRGGGCAFSDKKAATIQDANAHLIAAAPDLLAALKEVASHADDECGFMPLARAAIAKAEGGR